MLIKWASNDIINNANISFVMARRLSTQRAWDDSYDSHKSRFGSFCGQQCWRLSYMISCITTFISIITQSHIHIMDSFKVSVGFVCIWCRLLTADVADSLLSYFTNTFLHKFLVHVWCTNAYVIVQIPKSNDNADKFRWRCQKMPKCMASRKRNSYWIMMFWNRSEMMVIVFYVYCSTLTLRKDCLSHAVDVWGPRFKLFSS